MSHVLTTIVRAILFCGRQNSLRLIKGTTVKLQKREISAYNMIEELKLLIADLRTNLDEEHEDWFKEATEMAEEVGTEMQMPRITGRQIHRSNSETSTAINYYRVNYSVKFVDHFLTEFHTRYRVEYQVGVKLLQIIPGHFKKKFWIK